MSNYLTAEEREILRNQAIEAEELRKAHIETFLDNLSLESDINKTVALELGTTIAFIDRSIEGLKNRKSIRR